MKNEFYPDYNSHPIETFNEIVKDTEFSVMIKSCIDEYGINVKSLVELMASTTDLSKEFWFNRLTTYAKREILK